MSERLETVLDAMGFDKGDDKKAIKNFILKYREDTPHVQNPYALFDLLTKVAGFGGAISANMACGYVFGGPKGAVPPAWAQHLADRAHLLPLHVVD